MRLLVLVLAPLHVANHPVLVVVGEKVVIVNHMLMYQHSNMSKLCCKLTWSGLIKCIYFILSCHLKEDHGQAIFGVAFNHLLCKDQPNVFATAGSNRCSVYECPRKGGIKLIMCYADPDVGLKGFFVFKMFNGQFSEKYLVKNLYIQEMYPLISVLGSFWCSFFPFWKSILSRCMIISLVFNSFHGFASKAVLSLEIFHFKLGTVVITEQQVKFKLPIEF